MMSCWHHVYMTSSRSPLTDLILETFRLNGELLSAGDKLVADLQLTSARWQVLGAIGMTSSALPVAHIARNMGLSRQAVQRLVNELASQDFVRFAPNPHHLRAKLVMLTKRGRSVFDAAMERQGPWADDLAIDLLAADIETTVRVLRTLRGRLELQNDRTSKESRRVEEFA